MDEFSRKMMDDVSDKKMNEYLYSSSKSRKSCCHRTDCRHIGFIKQENRIRFISVKKAVKSGYRLCYHCFGIRAEVLRRKKQISAEFKKYNLKYIFSGSVVFVQSKISRWYFNIFEEQPVIFHKGLWNENKISREFHKQKDGKKFVSIEDAIEYISKHDRNISPVGPRNCKEERIAMLFAEFGY